MMRLVSTTISTWPVATSQKNDLCHLRGVLYLNYPASGRARERARLGTHLAVMDPLLNSTI